MKYHFFGFLTFVYSSYLFSAVFWASWCLLCSSQWNHPTRSRWYHAPCKDYEVARPDPWILPKLSSRPYFLNLCSLNFIETILSSWGRSLLHVKSVTLISYGLSYLGRRALVYNLHTHLFRCNLWQESWYTILFILVIILFRSHLLRLRPELIWVNSLPLWWLHRLILRVFS